MSSKTGLGSGIGTFTHTIGGWTQPGIDAWLRSFYEREGKERGAGKAREAVEAFVAEHFAVLYCPVCGNTITRAGETRAEWGKRRKCDACVAAKRKPRDVKFCRCCRATFERPDMTGDPRQDESLRKGWATVATCGACQADNRLLDSRAKAVAREVVEEEKQAYIASLSKPLRRRIRRGRRR